MGQRANLLTLRNLENVFSIKEDNSKFLINILEFLRIFKHFLHVKKVWAFKMRVLSKANTCYFEIFIFFLTVKCNSLKKLQKVKPLGSYSMKKSRLNLVFKHFFSFFKKNAFSLTFLNLNKSVKKKQVIIFFRKQKKFVKSLFDRRYNLFLDYLKISSLFCQGLISVTAYLTLLSSILRHLTKRSHSKFFEFLKETFLLMRILSKNRILGVKFIINGKLKGKARAGSHLLASGQIPQQDLSKIVDFSVVHTNTRLGVFGMRLWVYSSF